MTGGTLSFHVSGGNPGGYILATDTQSSEMRLTAPAKFVAKALKNGGEISFNAREEVNPHGNWPSFGEITLEGAGESLVHDFFIGDLTSEWTHISAPLTASAWDVSDQDLWNRVLANVTGIIINVESGAQVSEAVGFDNFSVTAVPLPSAIWFLAPALFVLYRRRASTAANSDSH